jgi:hypothetical protein
MFAGNANGSAARIGDRFGYVAWWAREITKASDSIRVKPAGGWAASGLLRDFDWGAEPQNQ